MADAFSNACGPFPNEICYFEISSQTPFSRPTQGLEDSGDEYRPIGLSPSHSPNTLVNPKLRAGAALLKVAMITPRGKRAQNLPSR